VFSLLVRKGQLNWARLAVPALATCNLALFWCSTLSAHELSVLLLV